MNALSINIPANFIASCESTLKRYNAAITGGLAGAWFGFSAIPARWVDALAPGLRQDLDILAAAAESHRNK